VFLFIFFSPEIRKRTQKKKKCTHLGEQLQRSLIVLEINLGPVDALLGVLLLLVCKDVSVKVLLQLLVCKVDAELLERVGLGGKGGKFD